MNFTVETWAPEYGIAADESQMDQASDKTQVDVERPAGEWAPITPPRRDRFPVVVFIDGVRRIDARVWITDGELSRVGVCASVAAGAVRCSAGEARVVDTSVARGVFAAANDDAPDGDESGIDSRHGRYDFVACAGDTAEDLYLGIHNRMTDLETRLVADEDAELVVFDGPLRGRNDPRGIGYVKTQHVQYLPDDLQLVLGALNAGDRTPLFAISSWGVTRYSWYLRLPITRTHPLAGIVRCELQAVGPVAEAIERADQVTAMLPRYASEPHKDGRAPQNLYPIAGLERDLRRYLGDPYLMERSLRIAAAN